MLLQKQNCEKRKEEQLRDNFSNSQEGFNENKEAFFTIFKFRLCEIDFYDAENFRVAK